MTTLQKSAQTCRTGGVFWLPGTEKPNLIVGRVDVVAVLIALLCICLLGFLAAALAIVQFAELISSLWSNSFDRWLVLAFAVAVVWVTVRWKNLCSL